MSLDSLIEGFLDTEFDEPVWSDSFIQRSLRTNLGYPIIAVNVLGLLWPADGNHRIAKCLLLGIAEIDAYVLENGQTMSYCEQPAMLA